MLWFVLVLPLVALGMGVVGLVAWRLWRRVRRLAGDVRAASDRLADAAAQLDTLGVALERRRLE